MTALTMQATVLFITNLSLDALLCADQSAEAVGDPWQHAGLAHVCLRQQHAQRV